MKKLFSFLCFAVLTPLLFSAAEERFNLSNLDKLTLEVLESMLPEVPKTFFAPLDDRGWWTKDRYFGRLSAAGLKAPKARLQQLRNEYKPAFSDTDWLNGGVATQYGRNMEKAVYMLHLNMMIEAVENKGERLPEMIRLAEQLCDAKTWVCNHHDRQRIAFSGKKRFIALETARVGAALAQVNYFLGGRMPPSLRKKISTALRQWILDPYREADRQEKLPREMFWLRDKYNWNAACHMGVVTCAALEVSSRRERAELFCAVIRNAVHYLDGFQDDGLCVEGVHYWQFGFINYVVVAETIRFQTGGRVDLLTGTGKIDNVVRFCRNLDMGGGLWPAYGDCPSDFRPNSCLIATVLRMRFGIDHLENLSLNKYPRIPHWLPMQELAAAAFVYNEAENPPPVQAEGMPLCSIFRNSGVAVSRSFKKNGLSLSFSGVSNGVNHGHADVGTFVVGKNGKPMIVDTGYQLPYWGCFTPSVREKSDICNSYGHSVPLANGIQQKFGKQYCGKILKLENSENRMLAVLDLTGAYPEEAKLISLIRTIGHDRTADRITISDKAVFSENAAFGSALITFAKLRADEADTVFEYEGQRIRVSVTANPHPLDCKTVPIKYKLANRKEPFRFGYNLTGKVRAAELIVTITGEE